jgi:branched-chain amino acid transport system substrate-binding protein
VCIYDLNNRSFAEPLWRAIQATFLELGGKAQAVYTFKSGETELKALMAEVVAVEPEGVLFIASPIDTALMIQYGRQAGLEALLFSSSWAQTEELIEKGGRAVEGLELAAGYDPQSSYPAFEPFVARFKTRYNRQPNMLASNGYEAVLVLAYALEQTTGRAEGLPEALTTVRNLAGVRGSLSINEYGDVERDIYIVRVNNSQFEIINTISPSD